MLRLIVISLLVMAQGAVAQDRRPSHCIALVEQTPGVQVIRASYSEPVPERQVRLSYIDHSMFLLQTPGGLSVVTDYNGGLGTADFVPDVVTMNQAHSSHWTPSPNPAIPHILPGWDIETGGKTDHWVDLGEMLIRNVSTDIRSSWSGSVPGGNSIFVFEVEGLCIGHLGHLHHMPTAEQFAALGRLDVVMAPVDGGMTLDLPTMIEVLQRLRSSVVIPMHWFSQAGLQTFLDGMGEVFRVDRQAGQSITVSLRDLPSDPTIVVLQPRYLTFEE